MKISPVLGVCCLTLLFSIPVAAGVETGAIEKVEKIGKKEVLEAMANPNRLPADVARDARSRPEEVIPLLNLESGDRVVDIYAGGGYYSELLASVVGRTGEVILHNSPGFEAWGINQLNDRFANGRDPGNIVRHTKSGINLMLEPDSLDAALIVMAIHDLYVIPKRYNGTAYVRVGNPANSAYFLEQVYNSLKPGGRFVVVDHDGNPDASLEEVTDLHRIDDEFLIGEIERAGFTLSQSSDVLRNPEDDHDRIVFDEDLQGATDRFILVFEKPLGIQ